MMNQENMMGEAEGWHVNIMLYDGHVASCLTIKQEPNSPRPVFVLSSGGMARRYLL